MSYDLKVASTDVHLFKQAENMLHGKYVDMRALGNCFFIRMSAVKERKHGSAHGVMQEFTWIIDLKQDFKFVDKVEDRSGKAKLIFIALAAQRIHERVNAKVSWFCGLCDWVISWVKETEKSKIDKVYKEVITLCQSRYNDPESYQFLSTQSN